MTDQRPSVAGLKMLIDNRQIADSSVLRGVTVGDVRGLLDATRPAELDGERRRVQEALFAWAEQHHADPPLVVVIGILDADGVLADEAADRIRARLTEETQ